MSDAAKDYPLYAQATAYYLSVGREKAFQTYEMVLERREGTYAEDRAAYCAGNISREMVNDEIRVRGRQLMKELAFCGRANEYVYKALIVYARDLISDGRRKEGMHLLREFPKSAGDYWEIAQFYLSEYDDGEKAKTQRGGGEQRNESFPWGFNLWACRGYFSDLFGEWPDSGTTSGSRPS